MTFWIIERGRGWFELKPESVARREIQRVRELSFATKGITFAARPIIFIAWFYRPFFFLCPDFTTDIIIISRMFNSGPAGLYPPPTTHVNQTHRDENRKQLQLVKRTTCDYGFLWKFVFLWNGVEGKDRILVDYFIYYKVTSKLIESIL